MTLQHFAFGQQGAGIGGPLNHRLIEFSGKFECFDEQKITRDERRFQSEFFIGGLFASTGFSAVDDIVV